LINKGKKKLGLDYGNEKVVLMILKLNYLETSSWNPKWRNNNSQDEFDKN